MPRSPAELLLAEPYAFDFFQAVRLLGLMQPDRVPVGEDAAIEREIVRFRAHASLAFPPSPITDLKPGTDGMPPVMTVSFFGLTGPSGVLPRHYTEMIMRLKDLKFPERDALRDWFDLFNHRFISLFYRAWEKYRSYVRFERSARLGREPDPFCQALYSLIGFGHPRLRHRLSIGAWRETPEERERVEFGAIDDLALLYYSGFLSQRRRTAEGLEAILQHYFELPITVLQFQGQWLTIDPSSQTQLESRDGANQLGISAIAGDRAWDIQGRIRVRVGPLRYSQFSELLPDRTPNRQRKQFFILSQLIRTYIGPEFDFEIQLVLQAESAPHCQLTEELETGARLGWNAWIFGELFEQDLEDAVFEGEELYELTAPAA